MDQFHLIIAIFEFAVLVFSLSIHEAAHGWMANRLGDPTAKMLGRVTLNPIKHIDPIGTLLVPGIMLFMPGYGRFLIGWAKPTPVTTRNFKNVTRDDILTTVAGPVSNVLAALVATLVLLLLSRFSPNGENIVHQLAGSGMLDPSLIASSPTLFPLALLFYMAMTLNLILAAFNLLPLPPLDGSHVFRHMLPYKALRLYDSLGIFSLILILFVGGRVVGMIVSPALDVINGILLTF
jgi:Zn-dependent protease